MRQKTMHSVNSLRLPMVPAAVFAVQCLVHLVLLLRDPDRDRDRDPDPDHDHDRDPDPDHDRDHDPDRS